MHRLQRLRLAVVSEALALIAKCLTLQQVFFLHSLQPPLAYVPPTQMALSLNSSGLCLLFYGLPLSYSPRSSLLGASLQPPSLLPHLEPLSETEA